MKLYNHTYRCIIHTGCEKASENPNTYIKISFVTNSKTPCINWDVLLSEPEAGPSTCLQMVGGELLVMLIAKPSKAFAIRQPGEASIMGTSRMVAKLANEKIWISVVLHESNILLLSLNFFPEFFRHCWGLWVCVSTVEIKIGWDQWIRASK